MYAHQGVRAAAIAEKVRDAGQQDSELARISQSISTPLEAELGHVWTAPWQELSDVCAALVGCGHVSGLLMRRGWPLALMLCADRVPIVYTHSEVR